MHTKFNVLLMPQSGNFRECLIFASARALVESQYDVRDKMCDRAGAMCRWITSRHATRNVKHRSYTYSHQTQTRGVATIHVRQIVKMSDHR